MGTFQFSAPTKIIFGCGSRVRIPTLVRGRRCGVVTSPSVLGKPEVAGVLDDCRARGLQVIMLGHVSPNPRLSEVESAYTAAAAAGVESVLAIGGGSVIDAAKLLSVAVSFAQVPRRVLAEMEKVVEGGSVIDVDLVAVPTTAGTGAEVSRGAIITDDVSSGTHYEKKAARGAELVPRSAVIDPELCISLSARRTAEAGFDVVCHAVETLLSRASTPVTDLLAWGALEAVPSALRAAYADGSDLCARETLSLHAWLMGYNLAHASTCLPHRMQYAIGSLTDTSHQIGLAALYPAWIRRVSKAEPELVSAIIARLAPPGQRADDPVDAMRGFLREIGLETSLKELGVTGEQVPELAAAVTGRVDLDPIDPSPDDIQQIFEEAFD